MQPFISFEGEGKASNCKSEVLVENSNFGGGGVYRITTSNCNCKLVQPESGSNFLFRGGTVIFGTQFWYTVSVQWFTVATVGD